MDQPNRTSESIDILIYIGAFWRRKYAVVTIFLALISAAFVKTMFLSPHIFRAMATIMPVKSERGILGALSANVRSLTGLGGIASGESDIDRFVSILKSRTITEQVVDRLNLMDFFYKSAYHKAKAERKELLRYILIRRMQNEILNITDNKRGLLEISIETKDPKMSAQIANTYVDLLEKYVSDNTLTTAKEHRKFVGQQFNRVKTDLAEAEENLKKFKEEHELISLSDEVKEMVGAIGQLRGQMLAKEFELEVLKKLGAAEGNVQYEKLKFETEELKSQIAGFGSEKNPKGNPREELFPLSPSKLPELEVQMFKLLRDKTAQETLYNLLAQYYESARLEEAREEPKFQRLDLAIPPMKKIKPQRKVDMVIGAFIGIAFSIAYVIAAEYLSVAYIQHKK